MVPLGDAHGAVSPFQGLDFLVSSSQGCALGQFVSPLWGWGSLERRLLGQSGFGDKCVPRLLRRVSDLGTGKCLAGERS